MVIIWIVLNSGLLPGLIAFDRYPFPFLGLIIGIEFIFLTTFVLMNQNLQSRRQEKWGHLTLQVCSHHITTLVEEIEKAREVGEELIEHLDKLQDDISHPHDASN